MDHGSRTPRTNFASGRTPSRHPRLALAGIVATAVAVGVAYKRTALSRNEQAQKSSADKPNLYVSVDRSGGGI